MSAFIVFIVTFPLTYIYAMSLETFYVSSEIKLPSWEAVRLPDLKIRAFTKAEAERRARVKIRELFPESQIIITGSETADEVRNRN